MKTIIEIKSALEQRKDRSAWDKGVTLYCHELLDNIAYDNTNNPALSMVVDPSTASRDMLNGASDWSQYSWGGCSLIYDEDIAQRLCCPSELKKTRNGERRPNSREEWLDVQARALRHAAWRIMRILRADRQEVSA